MEASIICAATLLLPPFGAITWRLSAEPVKIRHPTRLLIFTIYHTFKGVIEKEAGI